MGVLDTLEHQQHTGTGRARRYDGEALYLAAALLGLGDLGLPIGVIKAAAKYIAERRIKDRDFEQLWQDAKVPPKDIKRGPVYLCVTTDSSTAEKTSPDEKISVAITRGPGGLLTPSFYWEIGDALIMLSLTQVFARVKA
ncbi:MAG TPA: hypothetical protein VGM07_05105 [Stellaceae bacterium]